jgi:hypothetical protein
VEKYCTARHATDDNTIRHIQTASWITKATNTHSEYVTPLAFLLQQWLHERALIWSYTFITCLFIISLVQSTSWNNFRKITLNTVFPFTVRSSKKPLLNRTTYTKQVPSEETVSLASQKNSLHFIQMEVSLPCSKQLFTWPRLIHSMHSHPPWLHHPDIMWLK